MSLLLRPAVVAAKGNSNSRLRRKIKRARLENQYPYHPPSMAAPSILQQCYLDAMALVQHCGSKPDLFITFTANPNWPEVKSNLRASEVASNRPELVNRVFKHKLKELIDDIVRMCESIKVPTNPHRSDTQSQLIIRMLRKLAKLPPTAEDIVLFQQWQTDNRARRLGAPPCKRPIAGM